MSDALEDLKAAMRLLAPPTLLTCPGDMERVQAAVDKAFPLGKWRVIASRYVQPGQFLLVDEAALDRALMEYRRA